MPSRLRLREKVGNITTRRSRSSLRSATSRPSSPTPQSSPAPVARIQPSASATTASNLGPQPTIHVVPPSAVIQPVVTNITQPVIAPNPAFQLALDNYIKDLSPKDKQAFKDGNAISIDALMDQIRGFDETHSKTSRSRRCAETVEGFLGILKGFLGGLAPFLQQAPKISSLVIGGVNLIVDLGLRFAAFFGKLTDMMQSLGEHLGYLSKYAEGFMDSHEVQQALSCAYSDLLEFCKGARSVFTDKEGNQSRWTSFRVFLRITWEPFEAEFDSISTRFREHVEIVIRTANIVEYERLRLKETLEALRDEDKERRELLRWLSKLEFEDDHETIFSKRHGNTGDWLAESQEFKDWLSDEKTRLLWCHGSPGVGKTVLASLIVDKISAQYALDDSTGLAFVYYKYQNRGDQNSKNILSSLIKQLSRKKKILPDHLKEFYKQYFRQDESPSQMKLQAQLVEVSKSYDQVFIVIDALDECQDQDLFLPLIASLLQDSPIKTKVFVTSRREKRILNSFTKLGCPMIQIEAKKVDIDIAVFVSSEIDRRAVDYGTIDQDIKAKIKTALVSQSNGMFLWVAYQLDYIFEQPSPQDIEDVLKSLPPGLESTYNLIVKKIDGQVPAMKKLAKRALAWVVCAARPLRLSELVEAVAIEQGLESIKEMKKYKGETIIEACANLLTVEDDFVRPVHYSVQEFLTAPQSYIGVENRTPKQEYQIFPPDAHIELSQSCIQYMLFREFEPYPGITYDYWRLSQYRNYGFVEYITCFWDYHIRAVDEWPDWLCERFNTFLSTKPNLVLAYCLRIYYHRGDSTDLSKSHIHINALAVCLSVGLLHIFQKFHQLDASIHDARENITSLHYAAEGGSVLYIQALLDMGFSVDTLDRNGNQPLYYACENNHEAAVKLLLEKGADINAQGGGSMSALQTAAYRGHETIVGILLEKGAEVNAQGGEYGNALQAAAYIGHETIVGILLEKRAEVNAQGGEYGNALQAAACEGYETVVGILLEKGAEVNAQGGLYGNALQAAAYRGHETMVQLLLEKGADSGVEAVEFGSASKVAENTGTKVVEIVANRL